MTPDDYAGKGTLPPELERRVFSELAAGERLVWVGQPRPDLYRGQTIFMSLFGAFFLIVPLSILTITLAAMAGFIGAGAGRGNGWGGLFGCFPLCMSLFTLPFLLVGGWMLFAPVWLPARVRRIAYALTDRRALVWEPGWFKDNYTVRGYTREGLGRMTRVDRAGGAGDLVFEEYYTSTTDGDGYTGVRRNQRGFIGVDRVREVEELVRLTLLA